MTEITLSTHEPLAFHLVPLKKFRGTRLPGSDLYSAQRDGLSMHIQQFASGFFTITCRVYQFSKEWIFWTKEPTKDLRLEIIISGELPIRVPGKEELILRAGQYHITDAVHYQSRFQPGSGCSMVTIEYPLALLNAIGVEDKVNSSGPRALPHAMNELLFTMLQNPYAQELQLFFYDNCVRNLLFLHLAIDPLDSPGSMDATEVAAIHAADSIIAANLGIHLSIRSLARKVGLNEFTLKKGFKAVFGEGPFERLMKRRMQTACTLLETTDKPIKEIAELAGYSTLAGFITGFRRRFKTTPVVWRERSKSR